MIIKKEDNKLYKQEQVDIPFEISDRIRKRNLYVEQIRQIDEELTQVKTDFLEDLDQKEDEDIEKVVGKLTTADAVVVVDLVIKE